MAKNMKTTRNSWIVKALAVASGTLSGAVVQIGSAGLTGHVLTDRATTATIDAGTAAPGLADGEASVELIGIAKSVSLTVADNTTVGQKVYIKASDGTYTTTASGNTFIGYALEAKTGPATVEVGLAR